MPSFHSDISTQFQTPLPVCRYMVSLIPAAAVTILEPTPGIGNIVSVLEENSQYLITNPADYFLLDHSIFFDCIVMNPPFSDKTANLVNVPSDISIAGMKIGYYLLTDCMSRSNNVIALVPWFTIIDSDVRLRLLINYGLKSVTSLPRKTFSYTRIQTCIIELEKGFTGTTLFKYFSF